MYKMYVVDNFFSLTGIPANLKRNIIVGNRIANSSLILFSSVFMLK